MTEPTVEYRLSENKVMQHRSSAAGGIRIHISAMTKMPGKQAVALDTAAADALATFKGNYEMLNAFGTMSSVCNLNNVYFREIVDMGKAAVPFIHDELKKGPTDLVYALDAIFNYPIRYEGFIPLEKSCDIWLSILQKIEKN